jgi:hypothetical protein
MLAIRQIESADMVGSCVDVASSGSAAMAATSILCVCCYVTRVMLCSCPRPSFPDASGGWGAASFALLRAALVRQR